MSGLVPFRHRPRAATARAVMRTASILLGLTLVGACQTATARRTTPRFETAFSSTGAISPRPLVSVPNSGPVTSVEETRSSAGLRQRILFGQSRDRIDVTIASDRTWDDPAMAKPSRAGITAELATLDGSYRVLRQPVQNAYGPLGVAVSEHCAYAWQWIDALQRVELGYDALRGPVAVSLRVHHCRPRSTNADALLSDLTRIRLGVVADAPASRSRLRAARPRPPAASAEVIRPSVAPSAPASPPSVVVNSSRTLVNLPPTTATQPYLVQPAPPPAEPAIPLVPRPSATGGASDRARFLTDAMPASSRPATPTSQTSQSGSNEQPVRAASGSKSPPPGW